MIRTGPTALRSAAASALLAFAACLGEPPSAPVVIDELPRALSGAEQQVVAGGNAFAFDLLREVNGAHEGRNVFISPLSASMALGMTLNGARSTTFEGMRTALGLDGLEMPAIDEGYRDLIALLRGLDPRVELQIANSVWFHEGVPFEQDFLDASAAFFGARVEGLDFRSPAALTTINDWVKEATAGRIPKLLDEIEDEEVMFLINAIYFKGLWTTPFEKSRTVDAPFHLESGATVAVPMMSRTGPIATAYDASTIMVDLPYGGTAYSMTLVLPREGTTAETLAAEMTPARWNALLTALAPTEIVLGVPRFRVEWSGELKEPLAALGMAEAFDRDRADFRGISQAVYDAGQRLFLTRVVQKTFVAVDEAGTVAAAATAVGVGIDSAPMEVRFDRPFLVAIRERLSGTILFVGKIADPSRTD